MLEAAVVAWLVAVVGDRALKGARAITLGKPERQALAAALKVAWTALLDEVPPAARDPLAEALAAQFSRPPAARPDGRMSVKDALVQGVLEQVRPLTDPAARPSGQSYFQELGLDGEHFAAELPDVVLRAIQQVAPHQPALAPLASQLNADTLMENAGTLMERVDRILDAIQPPAAHPVGPGRPAPHPAGRAAPAPAYGPEVLDPVIDAVLDVPSMADYGARTAILAMLEPRVRDAIPRHAMARVEILNTIRTCRNYAGGLSGLVRAIRSIERDSEPMARLDAAILALGDAAPEQARSS